MSPPAPHDPLQGTDSQPGIGEFLHSLDAFGPEAIEVYCDESRPELFVSAGKRPGFAVIGSIWMPSSFRDTFKKDFQQLRERHNTWGEVKWKKVAPSHLSFYEELVNYFFIRDELTFRAIVVEAQKLDLERFHSSDAELGFYKFYYQLLTHRIEPNRRYSIFCDDKVNRDTRRLPVLARVLRNANKSSVITGLNAVDSRQVAAIQLCDVLMGATQRRFNGMEGGSPAKMRITGLIEAHLRRRISPTYPSEKKFNVFKINLESGR